MTDTVAPPRRGVRRGVYVLPALFTVGNIFCGYLSMDAALKGEFQSAAMILFLAGVLDGLDGRIARMTGTTSAFGEQLDSLADVISFGVAPAFLVYRWGLLAFDRPGLLVSFLFVVCGACRLARFNVQVHTVDKRHFVGLPIPSAAGALVGPIWVFPEPLADHRFQIAYLVITVVLSYLMVSTFRYRSFKDLDLKSKRSPLFVPMVAIVLAALVYFQQRALTVLLVVYAVSAPVAKLASVLAPRRKEAA